MANVSKNKKKAKLVKLTLEKHIEPNFFAIIVFVTKTTKFVEKQITGDWIMGHEACGELSKDGLKFKVMKYVSH
jgi:hypothetical protein